MSDQASALRKMMAGRQDLSSPGTCTCEVVAVTSGKGGVGKSNISMNLSIALAKAGFKVLILDADYGAANIDILINIDPRRNLGHVLEGKATLFQVLEKVADNLYLIPGASGISDIPEMAFDKRSQLRDDLVKIEQQFDYLVVDTSAGVSKRVINLLLGSDRVLLVCSNEPTAIVDAYALCKVLFQIDGQIKVELIANNVEGGVEAADVYDKLGLAVKHFLKRELHYLSHVIHDEGIAYGVINQKPLMLTGAVEGAAANFVELASKLAHPPQWAQGKGVQNLFNLLLETQGD